jgi:hypothetical protein
MTQADSVHSTPPTSTSAIDDPQSPAKLPAGAQDSLYLPTDVSPEEVFQAIGRLRKDARDEIDRLIRFLDESDNHMAIEDCAIDDDPCDDAGEAEPSLGWTEQEARWGKHATPADIDAELDNCDDEPSLARTSSVDQTAPQGGGSDCEGDEHDGAEPDEADEEDNGDYEPSLGSLEQIDQQRWRNGETGDLEQGTTRKFERSAVYAGRSNVTNLDGSPVTPAQLRGD